MTASIADLPNVPSRTAHRVGAAALLSVLAALAVDLLRTRPLVLGVVVAVVAFAAMLTLAWGARAGAVSFAPVLSMILSMAVPPAEHELSIAAWSACGSLLYLGWALLAGVVLQPRYRTLVVVAALRAAAELFRSRARVLVAYRVAAGEAPPIGAWIGGEAALAERLQAARDLLYPAVHARHWQRDVAILLRLVDLRDALLASRLDVDLLGSDDAGREILERTARALRRVADHLDEAGDALRDGRAPRGAVNPPLEVAAAVDELQMPADDARARLLPVLQGRIDRLFVDVARIHALLRGEIEPLPLTPLQLQAFVAPEGWPLRALRTHFRRDSLVLRHAVRMSLALATAYYLGLALPWAAHPYWLVLSVAVVLRGSLGDTLARRNARVLGTVLGCLLVVGLSRVPSAGFQSGIFLVALATAHAFVTQLYWVTSTAASVMALLQSHLVDPAAGFAFAERIGDTFLGAALAWSLQLRAAVVGAAQRPGSDQPGDARPPRLRQAFAARRLGRRRRRAPGAAQGLRIARRARRGAAEEPGRAARRATAGEAGRRPARPRRALHGPPLARSPFARPPRRRGRARPHRVGARRGAARSRRVPRPRTATACAAPPVSDEVAAELELLPAQPPALDVVPWLQRRLLQLVEEATHIRAAALASLPA